MLLIVYKGLFMEEEFFKFLLNSKLEICLYLFGNIVIIGIIMKKK